MTAPGVALPELAACLGVTVAAAGLGVAAFVLLRAAGPGLSGRVLAACRTLAVALAIPGCALALLLPRLAGEDGGVPRAVLQGLCLVPLVLLPPLGAACRLPAGLARTAEGLGAGRGVRARMLWLPLLGPSGLAALLLAVGGSVLVALVDAR
ncbi:hypothetical protein JUN65_16485 [Gluconacetobacter azotocaptans]|uniref:hypothetical protein n=1 Tax=Gluconacetobacter azotocaptans TaxID=142834 RepID=UPI001958B94D|nr:hypothetical protein [Gluconacetobacter azotocaptans]MBM9403174.1 hypothetical protein [Gluconacetobacter azotocaptans]